MPPPRSSELGLRRREAGYYERPDGWVIAQDPDGSTWLVWSMTDASQRVVRRPTFRDACTWLRRRLGL